MNRIIRAFAAFIVSICLILAPSIQYANAASSWNITGAVSAGARTVVSATKSGYKSAVNVMPTAGRLALRLAKTGNSALLLYAAAQLALDGVDFFIDPANNSVKYKVLPEHNALYKVNLEAATTYHPTREAACRAGLPAVNSGEYQYEFVAVYSNGDCQYKSPTVGNRYVKLITQPQNPQEKVLTVQQLASQVIKSANQGHSDSQAATRETATEMVIGGQFDQDLLQGAVPINDTKPLVPSVPISGNGNQSYGGVGANDGVGDDGMSGASPGDQADAAKDAADSAKKAAKAAADAAKAAAEDARKAADEAADLINSAADQAAIDAANQRAAAAEKAAAESKAVADAAVAAAAEKAAASERAAQAAAEKAAADAAAAQAAAAKAAADAAAASAANKAAADAAAAAAKAAADKAVAEAQARAKAAEEAAKAAEKAKAEATKPFELPAFCSWATKVCDFVDWVKADPQLEEPDMTKPEIQDLNKYDNIDISQNYISATGQCPPAVDLNINFGLVKLSYEPLCLILDKLSGVIVAVAYISAGFMIVRTV